MSEYLIEIPAHTGSAVETLRFTSGSGRIYDGYYYEPCVSNPGALKIMMFGEGTTRGASKIGYGEIQLVNKDGQLDSLRNYGIGGRIAVIRELIAGVTIGMTLSCSMEQPVFNDSSVSIRIKDPQVVLDVAFQENKYAGTNVLPAGVEGTADIKGKPKPVLLGQVSNATPFLVNTSRLIYQGHDGALQDIPAVYDKGVLLGRGTNYTSQADMEANPPAEGYYRAWLGGGMFRLGSAPAGVVTFDGIQGATAANRTAAQIAKQIALRVLTTNDLIDQDFTDLDTLNSAVIGIYINSETTIAKALDEVIGSIGGWYGFDANNKLNVGRLDSPSGTPEIELTKQEISNLQLLPTKDEGRGLPVWKVNLNYDKVATVQNMTSLAGSLNFSWVAGTLPASAYWSAITYGNGLFVAIPQNGSAYATSPDGIAWVSRTLPSPPTGGYWVKIAYGNGTFVLLGNGANGNATNVYATSTDGINWTPGTLPVSSVWVAITYANGRFVALAASSTVCALSSTDGTTWSQGDLANGTWTSVAYGNNVFVAITYNGSALATSPDGVTWTARTPTNSAGRSVTFGNGLFVAIVYNSNVFATSPDGITWTARTMPMTAYWSNITYGNRVFVATVENNSKVAAVSPDGILWYQVGLPSAANWQGIAYGNGSFIAVSFNSANIFTYRIAPSTEYLSRVSLEYRTVNDFDNAVLTVHPLATEITLDSLLVSSAAAQTETTRQLSLRKVRRDYVSISIDSSVLASMPTVGKVIKITYPRYGYDAGKLFVLIGVNMELSAKKITFYLWG
ncbi:hypothetical protein KI809_19130 [Geobacter pelophilus]|uniref:DUF6242 domain-containing protein n=1 Tax=Geoanaerobacter pelophilus TaxID=60036 RepID=A0AAW4LET7_9BACT|nr:hypothetical protein [Geoanaerobacter pelophilus]MBT0666427.1 hypothetical protein [Geoanaerobacter pelophilus]